MRPVPACGLFIFPVKRGKGTSEREPLNWGLLIFKGARLQSPPPHTLDNRHQSYGWVITGPAIPVSAWLVTSIRPQGDGLRVMNIPVQVRKRGLAPDQ